MKIAKFLLPLAMSASLFGTAALAQTDASTGNSAPAAQTQVEIKNEAPAAQAPAAPNIDIDMPKAPDINVTTPGSTNTETRTEEHTSSTTIIDDADDPEPVGNNSLWLYVLFGVLAIFLVVAMISAGSRRTTVTEGAGRRTTIIDD